MSSLLTLYAHGARKEDSRLTPDAPRRCEVERTKPLRLDNMNDIGKYVS